MRGGADLTSRTFERLSRELSDCETAGLRIEAAVADLITSMEAGHRPASSPALQELDSLVQRLRDLAAFAAVLGTRPGIGPADLSDAIGTLKLQRVRLALAGTALRAEVSEPDTFF